MENKPMKLLLIEDDIKECNIYKEINKARKDIKFVAMTGSDIEGLKYVKDYMPEGIILDLELNKGNGTGTGFNFLKELKQMKLTIMPKIVVTTNICSDSVYEFLHENGVEFIFYKKQNNYSQENVINTILLVRGYKSNIMQEEKEEININNQDKISEKIKKCDFWLVARGLILPRTCPHKFSLSCRKPR